MFEASTTLQAPARSLQSLWRYMSARRLKDLLTSNELFFAHLPTLDDSREGTLTKRTRRHLATWYQVRERLPLAAAYEQVDDYLNAQRWFYVNCWHMNDHESYLMWKAYGGRGFAVVTTLERLQASFDQTPPVVTGGVVQYVDFARELTAVGNVFDHVAMKDLPYRDEREYRLVFWEVDPRNADYPREAAGVRVKVDIPMLVQRIVRSPYPEPIDVDLERLLEGHKQKFGASTISPRSA